MKKFYIIALIAGLTAGLNAQNILNGSAMETADEASWLVSGLNSDGGTGSVEFGYTDDTPTDGEDGCVRVIIEGTAANTCHQFLYQEVTIKRGATYALDYAAKTLNSTVMNNSWVENYITFEEPGTADVAAAKTTLPLGGFKFSGWVADCTDEFDALLSDGSCLDGNPSVISGSDLLDSAEIAGDEGTFYFGIKIGIWGADHTIEIGLDNITLTEGGTAVNDAVVSNVKLYPNPVNDVLTVVNANADNAKIYNVVGQMVKDVVLTNGNAAIDVSELEKGVYLFQVGQTTQKFVIK